MHELILSHVSIGPILAKHNAYDSEKDRHTEAMAQTDVKYYRDVNVSAQIIHDQNERYLDPYHRTYDQQTEAMVQTDFNKYSKNVLTGSDTPLQLSRGAPRVPSPRQFHHHVEELKMNEDYFESMPSKRTFKLDLSSVCADDDSFEFLDDDEAFTDEDNNSSIMYHGKTYLYFIPSSIIIVIIIIIIIIGITNHTI